MVDDSKEAEKEPQPSSSSQQRLHYTRNPSGDDDFARTIAKIAVAQICENEGFQGFHQSALDALSDVALRYVKELGKASSLYANLAGRSECNVFDLIQGLEDLGFVQGFSGASDVHRPLAKLGVVREIGQYVNFIENVPFVFDVPSFPVCKECKLPPSFLQSGDEPPGEHIPAWLPAFPRVVDQGDGFPDDNVGTGGVEKGVEVATDELPDQQFAAKDRVEGNVNPFLAPPFRYGEKDFGLVEPPSRFYIRNDGDMMDAYGGMSGYNGLPKELLEIEDKNNSIRSDERPTVRLNFNNVKSLRTSNIVSLKKMNQKLASCFGIEDENDDQNVWSEEPLKESAESRQLDNIEL